MKYAGIIAKICFGIAVVFAIFAAFAQPLGPLNPGAVAIVFIAAGLLLA